MTEKQTKIEEEGFIEAGTDDLVEAEKMEEIKEIRGILKAKREPEGKRESMVYGIETSEKYREIWGSTVLDNKLKKVPLESQVIIEYLGKEPSKQKGRNPYHNVSVKYKAPKMEEA